MAIVGLQNRNIKGSAYNAHFAAGLGVGMALVLSQQLVSWSIVSSRDSCTEGGGIHFSAVPLPASGAFSKADLLTVFMFAKYRWDFGDAGAGTWATDGSSRNAGNGPEAGHVFRDPGSYTVTLYVTEGGIETAVATKNVTVADADTVYAGANAICFSNDADFTGAPAGSTQITTSSFDTAWANLATGKRLLFKRGHTFTAASSVAKATSAAIDDFLVGDFGAGALPIIQNNITGGGAPIDIAFNSAVFSKNHTIRNLQFHANQSATQTYSGINYHGYNEHLTIDGCEFVGINYPVSASYADLGIQTNISSPRFGIVIHGNTVDNYTTPLLVNTNGNMHIFGSGNMLSIVGNTFKNGDGTVAGDTHIIRLADTQHAEIWHNDFQFNSKNSRHSIKLHGDFFKGSNLDGSPRWFEGGADLTTKWFTGMYNEFISIGLNKNSTSMEGQDWAFAIGPQNAWSPEEVRGIIVCNNYFTGAYGQQAIVSEGSTIAIRNNVVNAEQWPSCGVVNVNNSDSVMLCSNHFVYKNTLYKKNSVSGNAAKASIHMGTSIYPKGVSLNNNLVYALPKDGSGWPAAGLTDSALQFEYSESGNVYDPENYPFTGTNPPGDSMNQFTLISSGSGADVGDY
jgi:hypothetical protein